MFEGNSVSILPQTPQLRAMHAIIRDRGCSLPDFVHYSRRITRLLLEEALNHFPHVDHRVTTPVGAEFSGKKLDIKICAVPVIRAGESMECEFREIMPGMPVGKILIQRDKSSKQPHYYYHHLPPSISEYHVLLLEPMLATAGSALAAVDLLKESGVDVDRIVMVNVLSSPEGLRRVEDSHPELTVVTSSVEEHLNEQKFMIPGIGDFGDRFFGTTAPGAAR